MRCGLCLHSCPLSDTWPPRGEVSAPRGKMAVLRRLAEGSLSLDEEAQAEFWYRCTTCRACEISCPAGVPLVDLVVEARNFLVEKGRVPGGVAAAFRSIYLHGNPWRRPAAERVGWAGGLKVKDLSCGEQARTLLYVGCLASYDPRARQVARAMAEILTVAGVDFAILGTAEPCCGREVYSLGETGLFDRLRDDNLACFRRYRIERVVTLSPHCYDAFRNLYPAFAEIWHYTQFIETMVKEGRLKFKTGPWRRVTYHDPCYLGRHNGIYEAPRELLRHLPGLQLLEMPGSREKSLCCEGGGGRSWFLPPYKYPSLAGELLDRAAQVGAEVLAVACPFCLTNLAGVGRPAGGGDTPAVADIIELLLPGLSC